MAVTEEERLSLRAKLNEVLGEREAAVLMESVPPVHYDQLATKNDLLATGDDLRRHSDMLRSELKGDIARLDVRMAQQLRVTVLTHVGSMIGLAAFLSAFN